MGAVIRHLLDPETPAGAVSYGVILFVCAIIAAQLVGIWSRRLQNHHLLFIDRTAAGFIGALLKLACFLVAAILYAHLIPVLQKLGTALLASAGVISLVLGLAAQNTLGHLIAGIALLMYRPFGVGDTLMINTPTGKETGTVQQFTLGYTKLLTEDGRWILVPNSVMISSVIIKMKPAGDPPPQGL